MGWGKKPTEAECPSHGFVWRVHAINMTCHSLVMSALITCQRWCLPGFRTVVWLFFPPLYWTLWKEVTIFSPHFQSRELCFTPLRMEVYILKLEFFCVGDLSLPPHIFIYSIVYLCHCVFMDIYFSLWVIIQITQYHLIFWSNCFSFGYWEFL